MLLIALALAIQPMLADMRAEARISRETIRQLREIEIPAPPRDRILPVLGQQPAGSGAKTCEISADG